MEKEESNKQAQRLGKIEYKPTNLMRIDYIFLPLEIKGGCKSLALFVPYQLYNEQQPHSQYPPLTMHKHLDKMIL